MKNLVLEKSELYCQMKDLRDSGCMAQYLDDVDYDGRILSINNEKLLNFANCCYLGIEKHPKLIEGAIEAVKKFGTQNSISRSMISSSLFSEIESSLSKIFPGYPIVYGSTTLAHYSALPLLVKENDAIILDAYVHNSVRTASQLCKANGSFVLVSKHNDMEHVSYLIKRLKKEGYHNIWYCADGIYSMHGDLCDVKGLQNLLDEEDNFYAYVDDAHGLGWCGNNGCGYVIGNFGLHEKMIVIGSLSKSIGVAGGILVVPDKTLADCLKLTGHTFIFSIPMPPSSLGALNASLKLHLSNEISLYQNNLIDLIYHFRKKSQELFLPILTKDSTPIQLIKIGNLESIHKVQKRLIEKGYFQTMAAYPAVSKDDGGIRVSLTRHLTKSDIDSFLTHLKEILEKEKIQAFTMESAIS
jgi:7-keto-8-aminopelargonate synthetase-like enzyme